MKNKEKNTKLGIYAIGNFDGVHRGHQVLINKAKEMALDYSLSSGQDISWGVISFNPHPVEYFHNKKSFLITPAPGKEKIIKEIYGGDFITINFTKSIAEKGYEDFFKEDLVNNLGVVGLVTGSDFSFGCNKEGKVEELLKLTTNNNMVYNIVDKVLVDGKVCSSSYIRECFLKGNIKEANKFLGREFSIKGLVIKGKQLGRLLGFPTANIIIDDYAKLKYGVYVTRAIVDGIKYKSVANFGVRPSIDGNKVELLEVNLFDFSGDLYGKEIEVEFLDYIRSEKKFNSMEELKENIASDADIAKNYFNGM